MLVGRLLETCGAVRLDGCKDRPFLPLVSGMFGVILVHLVAHSQLVRLSQVELKVRTSKQGSGDSCHRSLHRTDISELFAERCTTSVLGLGTHRMLESSDILKCYTQERPRCRRACRERQ